MCWKSVVPCAAALFLVFMIPATCVSQQASVVREKALLDQVTESNKDSYTEYLVPADRYTTRGNEYQEKYRKHLVGIAIDLISRKYEISRGSIGFYFDKKSKTTSKLYLGLDLNVGKSVSASYETIAIELLQTRLRDIIGTVHSCRSVFDEGEVVGMVVGWKWLRDGAEECVNIWVPKNDVLKFEEDRLTFEELLTRSTITNTSGKVIRLR